MSNRKMTKIFHEGRYVAEVDVELQDTGDGWSPYLSIDEARKLDEVRVALRTGDLHKACSLARVFSVQPVAA